MAKRPMTQVQGGFAQATLFGEAEAISKPAEEQSPRYLDPSPLQLTIGGQTLEQYLVSSGQSSVFAIREVVRSLDYSQFRKSKAGAQGGRPPFHPAIYLGLILFSVMRGVGSLRGIERVAKSDVCCWWLTGGLSPDHTSIGRFIQEHEELIAKGLFEEATRAILKKAGAKGTDLSGDGTTIESVATRYKKITAESAAAAAAETRSLIEKTENAAELARLEAKAKRLERAATAAEERTARRQKDRGSRREIDPAKVAPSDPDATYQKLKDGSRAFAYKPVVFANEQRMIVAQTVETSNENAAIDGLCDQAKAVAGAPLECLRLDAGFSNRPVLTTLLKHEVEDVLVTDRPVAEKLRRKVKRRFAKKDFSYDEAEDTYTCPAGHKLTRSRPGKKRPKRARYSGAPCGDCPLRGQCTSSKRGRVIQRTPEDEIFEAMRETLSYPAAQANYAQRAAMVEPVFADLRQIQGLRRFLRRGLMKVRAEFSLHAIAHNLGRLVAVLAAELAQLWVAVACLWAALGHRSEPRPDRSAKPLRIAC